MQTILSDRCFIPVNFGAVTLSDIGCSLRQRGDHFLGVALRLHLVPYLLDDALLIQQEGRALDSHIGPAVVELLYPSVAGFGELMIDVGEQREVEIELPDK